MRFTGSVTTGRALPVANAISGAIPLGATPRILRAVLPPGGTAVFTAMPPALRMPMRRTTRMGPGMGLRRITEALTAPERPSVSRTRSRVSLARWWIERSADGRSCHAHTHPDGSRAADAGRWHRAGWSVGEWRSRVCCRACPRGGTFTTSMRSSPRSFWIAANGVGSCKTGLAPMNQERATWSPFASAVWARGGELAVRSHRR